METTLFLAKVFGLYLIAMAVVFVRRRKALGLMIEGFAGNPPLAYLASIVALILGLVLVVSHNVWVAGWPLIITILSWVVLIKALAFLLLPFDAMARLMRWFDRPALFTVNGAFLAALGLFLAGKGFQIF
jgi:hypothetical protein